MDLMLNHLMFLPALPLFLALAASGVLAQTPMNPPPGIQVPPEIRQRLEVETAELGASIKTLQAAHRDDPAMLDLINDVIVYYNAVHYALELDQFYRDKNKDEFAIAFRHLETGRERAAALQAGKAPWIRQTGLVVRGYRSRIDDSVQPYGLVIPENFDFQPTYGSGNRLDIWYHGRGNTLSELKFIDQRETDPGKLITGKAMVLHPYGRYCNANKFAGETDTFEALEHVKRHYAIDPRRISVRGFSMGGAVTWHMAAHHAGLWSAAAPGAGFAETAVYADVMVKDPKPAWYELKLHALYDATKYAANLHQCPVIAYSGSEDKQKQAADIMAEHMSREGLDLQHVIGDGMGHKYDDRSLEIINRTVDGWTSRPKDQFPGKITFVTYTLRYNKMHWLTIDALKEHWKEARVEAEIADGYKLQVKARNIAAFTIDLPPGNPLLRSPGVVHLDIDGTRIRAPGVRRNGSWNLSLKKDRGQWTTTSNFTTGELQKRHGLQGPIDDAFYDSFIFVLPSGEEASNAFSDWVDSESADARLQWWRQFRGKPRVKFDHEITEDDIARHHLILWGDPSSNRILERIQKSLPVTWQGKRFIMNGETYDASSAVPVLIYPNPLNPGRYVVVNSGFTFSEFAGGSNSLQVPKLPDWAVIDLSTPRNQRHPAGVLEAGFFDEAWQYKEHD